MQIETGRYELRGGHSRGLLGATYTGRSIDVEGEYPAAKEWLENYEASPDQKPDLERELIASLKPAPKPILDAPLFRGRFLSQSPTSVVEFGPPPRERSKRGRYNAEGEPALYLCSTRTGVVRELGPPPVGHQLWLQQFRILPELRICDARELPIESLAAAVFWLIEHGRDRCQFPRLGARVGQLISHDYDGLIVPGVRGEPPDLYWNLIVFRPNDRWIRLIAKDTQPEALISRGE